MRREAFWLAFAAMIGACASAYASAAEHQLLRIRVGYWEDRVRVVCDVDGRTRFEHRALPNPHRIELDLAATDGSGVKAPAVRDRIVTGIGLESLSSGAARVTISLTAAGDYRVFALPPGDGRPDRIVCDVFYPKHPPQKPAPTEVGGKPESAQQGETAPAAEPKAEPKRPPEEKPQAEAKPSAPKPAEAENWVVVIDAGHGGMDPGAVHGKPRLYEKEVTLDVAKLLAREMAAIPGVSVRMTRQKDEYVGLRERLRKAETQGAEVFVSIHVNGCNAPSARGAEVFFLSMIGATDAASKELEALENQSAVGEESLDGDLADLPFAVDLIQTDTLKRSSLLAEVLLNELGDDGLATTRGVKQANFVVLRSIRVPSVLVELGFLSNANDADALRSVQHREALGKSLARGLVDFRSRFARHSPAP